MADRFVKSNIKLTIGILVSNRIEYIRKTMESLKPLLVTVPSELIVVDTKGTETDGSVAVAREYTDKIYPFTWCNDFAAARNVCMEHARGEWFLYMDDDEWFDDVTEFIDFFKNGECEQYNSGFYFVRNYQPGGGYSTGIVGRMVRRKENTRFVGKIHETFNEVSAPNKVFSSFVHHYGYADTDEEKIKEHQERNMSILRKEFEEQGYVPRICAQTVQELLSRPETAKEGLEFAEKSISELEKQRCLMDSCSQWVLVATVRYYIQRDDYENAKKQAEFICGKYSLTHIAHLVLTAAMLRIAGEHGDLSGVLVYAEQYLKEYDWKKQHEAEALLQTQLDFPRYYGDGYYYNILRVAAVAANYMQDFECANRYWKRMPWEQESFDGSEYQADYAVTIQGLKQLQEQKQVQLLMEKQEQLLATKRKQEKQQEAKKQEISIMLQTLLEAGEYAKKNVLSGNFEVLDELLSGMQELAITIGQSIDVLFGEGTKAVSDLEKYCELLWQCSQAKEAEELLAVLEQGMELIRGVIMSDMFYEIPHHDL